MCAGSDMGIMIYDSPHADDTAFFDSATGIHNGFRFYHCTRLDLSSTTDISGRMNQRRYLIFIWKVMNLLQQLFSQLIVPDAAEDVIVIPAKLRQILYTADGFRTVVIQKIYFYKFFMS